MLFREIKSVPWELAVRAVVKKDWSRMVWQVMIVYVDIGKHEALLVGSRCEQRRRLWGGMPRVNFVPSPRELNIYTAFWIK